MSPLSTSDYFNGCADPTYCGVPIKFQGYQPANSGFTYAGMYFWTEGFQYLEFIQLQLTKPIQADQPHFRLLGTGDSMKTR